MNILFMGTPDFAVVSLNALAKAGHNISAVVTMPDKPRGRGHKMVHTPVYDAAETLGAQIFTPENLKRENFEVTLNQINPDVIVVVAYGHILPEYVLNFPKYGCINVHASLLPRYRGAAPIQRSIIDGETVTGVTTMFMEKGLDTGDMLMKTSVNITEEDNFETLHDKLADVGADLICKTLDAILNGTCIPEKQDDSLSDYAHMITKETCLINWNKDARDIFNLVRGLYPVPKAFTNYGTKQMKILSCRVASDKSDSTPGTIFKVGASSFFVACANNTSVEVTAIQPEGKKMMSVSDYLKGNSIELNSLLK